ncbi:hypothetical protein D3C80_1181700 [compost metagenome]
MIQTNGPDQSALTQIETHRIAARNDHVAGRRITEDLQVTAALGGPEPGRRLDLGGLAQDGEGGGAGRGLGVGPGFHAGGGAVADPRGQIAHGEDAIVGGRAVVVADQNSARHRQARRLGHLGRGDDADADDDQVGLYGHAIVQPGDDRSIGGVFQRLQ